MFGITSLDLLTFFNRAAGLALDLVAELGGSLLRSYGTLILLLFLSEVV